MNPKCRRNHSRKHFLASLITILVGLCSTPPLVAQSDAEPGGTAGGPADAPAATGDAGYDGGFFLESADDKFRLEFSGRLQTQYEAVLADPGDGYELAKSRFLIRRARLKLSGHAFSERLTYAFQTDYAGGDVDLLEYFMNYALVPESVEGRVGQWRLPFLRQQITSSGSLLLVDRSLVANRFGEGFDIGVAAHNGYGDAPGFEWTVGVFNGTKTGLDVITPDDPDAPTIFFPSAVARVGYNFGKINPYKAGDLEGGPLRFAVGASGLSQLGVERDNSAMKATVDYVVKAHRFSSSGAYAIASGQDEQGDGLFDQDQLASGFFVQAGYVIGEMIQPAARYSRVEVDDDGPVDHEVLGGINVYFYGHKLKWQTDAGALVTENDSVDSAGDEFAVTETDWQARTQVQLSF
jgi:hypothetical protein